MKHIFLWMLLTSIWILRDSTGTIAQEKKKTIWQGVLHLGDNPESYRNVTSAGLGFQVPFRIDPAKIAKLTITVNDVQTQAGQVAQKVG